MAKGFHGDRTGEPLPIEELVARHEVEIEGGPQQDPTLDPDWQQPTWQELRSTLPPAPEEDIDAGVRMQSAAIAGGSFGAAGCFDDEILLRRANAIFQYIRNGLQ
jgi:hypothetical protein